MSITVQWDDPDRTILRYTYNGDWTWQEYDRIALQVREMAKDAGGAIDVIADFSLSTVLPTGALSNFRRSFKASESSIRFSTAVLVIRSEFMSRMLDVFGRLYGGVGSKIRSARSIDEAHQMISEIRKARLVVDDASREK